ncbi:MAG TPA: GNAT family N-acetyltransferase [Candidatus Baltobacteraceae bacterium]|nr:GNAT family N-acetyltransferase [Candidatus Baltobacteraceae bacterium]
MIAYREWEGAPPAAFAQFWYAMLEECDLLGSGAVSDWESRLTNHFAAEMQSGRMRWFVADAGGEVVGTAAAILQSRSGDIWLDKSAMLAGIYVVPSFRRKGIARELTQRAIAWCKAQGCALIKLQASQAGRPLYESLGFTPGTEMLLWT